MEKENVRVIIVSDPTMFPPGTSHDDIEVKTTAFEILHNGFLKDTDRYYIEPQHVYLHDEYYTSSFVSLVDILNDADYLIIVGMLTYIKDLEFLLDDKQEWHALIGQNKNASNADIDILGFKAPYIDDIMQLWQSSSIMDASEPITFRDLMRNLSMFSRKKFITKEIEYFPNKGITSVTADYLNSADMSSIYRSLSAPVLRLRGQATPSVLSFSLSLLAEHQHEIINKRT